MQAMRVKALVVGAFALGLVVGWSTGTVGALAQAAAACVQTGPTGEAVTLNGSGGMDTQPIALAGGIYRAAWQGNRDCVVFGELRRVDGAGQPVRLWSSSGQTSVEGWAYGVPAATYFLHMNSSCSTWSATLQPQG
jgi:hypothetical protein